MKPDALTIKQILLNHASVFDGCISPDDFDDIEKEIEEMYSEREYD